MHAHTHTHTSPKQAWQINKTFLCDQQLQWNLASQKLDEHSMLYFTNILKIWITTVPYVQRLYLPPMLPLLQRDLQWLVLRFSEGSLILWSPFVKRIDHLSWRQAGGSNNWTNWLSSPRWDTYVSHHSLFRLPFQLAFPDFPDKKVNLTLKSQNIFRQVWEAKAFGSLWV